MVLDKHRAQTTPRLSSRLILIADVLLKVKLYLLAHPDVHHDHTRWIVGMGWDQTNWPGGEFPTAVCAYTTTLLCHPPPLTGPTCHEG